MQKIELECGMVAGHLKDGLKLLFMVSSFIKYFQEKNYVMCMYKIQWFGDFFQ